MANGLSPRDIDLIFKANTSGAARPIGELGTVIDSTRGKVKELNAETDKGVDVTADLKAAYKELTSALSEVKDNYSILAKLQTAQDKEQAQVDRIAKLTAAYDTLAAKLAATEKPSQGFQDKVDRAATAVENAKNKLAGLQATTQSLGATFEAVGGDAKNLEASQIRLAEQAANIGRGVKEVESALSSYETKAKDVTATNLKLAESQSFDDLAKGSGLPQAQIDHIREQANSYKLLEAAIKEAAQSKRAFDEALTSQATKIAADTALSLGRNLAAVEQAEQRIAQNRAFAQIATESIEAANNQVRFKASLDGSNASATTLRDTILSIIAPERDALTTLEGISQRIQGATATLDSPKQLRTSQYQDALNSSSEAGAAAGRLAGQIDNYQDQQRAVDAATQAFKRQQAAVLDAAEALRTNANATESDVTALRTQETALERAGTAMRTEQERLAGMSAALQKAGVDTNHLKEAQEQLTATANRAQTTIRGLSQKTGATGDGGLFGLKPYELQNLSYQVNDVVTGLASGQRPLQILAQQGGQIAQIFPGFTSALIANAGALIGIGAAAAIAIAGLVRVHETVVSMRDANEIIASLGDNAQHVTSEGIAPLILHLQELGQTSQEAKTIISDLVNNGFNTETMSAFIDVAQSLAEETGVKLPDAIKTVSAAFDGSIESIAKLQDKTHFLTQEQFDHIQREFELGKSADATSHAFDIYAQKVDAARTPTSQLTLLVRNLRGAFDQAADAVAKSSFIQDNLDFFGKVGAGLNTVISRLRGVSAEAASAAAASGRVIAPGQQAQGTQRRVSIAPQTTAEGKVYLQQQRDEAAATADIADKTKRAAAEAAIYRKAIDDAHAHGVQGADAEVLANARLADYKAKAQKSDDAAAAKADRERDAAARKAEAAAKRAAELEKRIADEGASLSKSLGDLTAAAAKGGAEALDEQLKAAIQGTEQAYNALIQKAEDFRKLTGGKGTIGGLSIDDYEKQARAQSNIIEDEQKLAVYEKNVNDLIKARNDELKDIADRAKSGGLQPGDALKEATEVTSRYKPLIEDAAKAGKAFADGIKSGVDAANTNKVRQTFTSAVSGAGSSDSALKDSARGDLADQEQKINDIVQARNKTIQAYNSLQQQGFISQKDANKNIDAAYSSTTKLIKDQIAQMEKLIDAAEKLGAISPESANAMRASLKETGAETAHVTELQKNLKTAVDQAITNDAVTTIENMAKALANAVVHGGSFKDIITALGAGLANLVADVLETVAKLILESLILDAVQNATGIPIAALLGTQAPGQTGGAGGGGGIFGFLGKLFHDGTSSVGSGGSGQSRTNMRVTMADVAAAPRYHLGTSGAGLDNTEVLSVLKKGEAVLPENHPDHPANKGSGSSSSSGPTGIRQVLAVGDDQIAAALTGGHGEKVVLTHIKRNAPTIKQLLA